MSDYDGGGFDGGDVDSGDSGAMDSSDVGGDSFDSGDVDFGADIGADLDTDIDIDLGDLSPDDGAIDMEEEISYDIQSDIDDIDSSSLLDTTSEVDFDAVETDLPSLETEDDVILSEWDANQLSDTAGSAEVSEIHDDGTLPGDIGYVQGNNEEGLENDCGLATAAGNLNRVTGSELSENDMVETALGMDMTSAEYDGGTYSSTEGADAVGRDTLYETVSEQTPEASNLNIDKVSLDSSDMDDINAALQSGGTLDASVDSSALWGDKESFDASDHAIGIDEPAFDENGDTVGYMIRDTSGSGKEFATTEELENAGLFENEQILITKT